MFECFVETYCNTKVFGPPYSAPSPSGRKGQKATTAAATTSSHTRVGPSSFSRQLPSSQRADALDHVPDRPLTIVSRVARALALKSAAPRTFSASSENGGCDLANMAAMTDKFLHPTLLPSSLPSSLPFLSTHPPASLGVRLGSRTSVRH